MKNVKEFYKVYNQTLKASRTLSMCLQELGMIASELYGERLRADICTGDEIEFRRCDEGGQAIDDMECIDAMEILEKELDDRLESKGIYL